MDQVEFKKLLTQLQEKRFGGLSDTELMYYSHIYHSVYVMINVNSLTHEYGSLEQYRRKLDILYRTLMQRYHRHDSLTEKAKILNTIYMLSYETGLAKDEEKDKTYFNEGSRLIASYIRQYGSDDSHEALCYILRLIIHQWFGYTDWRDSAHESIHFLKSSLDRWTGEISREGEWPGISHIEALRRIKILSQNAHILNDTAHDATLQTAYRHYCDSFLRDIDREAQHTDQASTELLVMMYQTIHEAAFAYSHCQKTLNQIAQAIETHGHNTENIKSMDVLVSNTCMNISQSIQNSLAL